jgi:hypothetical protein
MFLHTVGKFHYSLCPKCQFINHIKFWSLLLDVRFLSSSSEVKNFFGYLLS